MGMGLVFRRWRWRFSKLLFRHEFGGGDLREGGMIGKELLGKGEGCIWGRDGGGGNV